jgi:hypothetical protein
MRKVLLVSPHFPPINAPDHQRVRMALPYFEQFGWRPTVLAVAAEHVEGGLDPLQEQMLPKNVRIVRTGALPVRWMRLAGIRGLAYRAFGQLRRTGDELLRAEKFDLVFVSTTLFPVMTLGRRWKRRHNVPYVLDFQDPWWSDYYERHPGKHPPGGRLKYGFSQWLARRNEPPTVRDAAHVVSVSTAYVQQFLLRYPDLPAERFTTLPFGASELDFSSLANLGVSQSVFDPRDGKEHWVYIGRGGEDMAFAVRAFFTALKRYADEHSNLSERLRLHFIGTDYAPKNRARKTVEPLARECGVDKLVTEQTGRLPYFTTLRCLSDAEALFIPGSDDPGYTASKLYPYVLAKKPLLAVFHKASSVVDILRRTNAGKVVTFGDGRELGDVAKEIYREWFAFSPLPAPQTDWDAFSPYTARSMTRQLCHVFDRVLAKPL